MRNLIIIGSLAAAMSLPILAGPTQADAASCRHRKTTGTIIGGVGGALLGGAVTHGSTGPIVGSLGGAVVGHEIGRSGCRKTRTAYYAPSRAARAAAPAERVYYDQYGRPVPTGAAAPVYYPR